VTDRCQWWHFSSNCRCLCRLLCRWQHRQRRLRLSHYNDHITYCRNAQPSYW